MKITNPILTGFNPDPCICKANGMYYIATSTFEWFPGVQIYKSKDLVEWELISCPLDSDKFMDLRGVPDSAGIWAPALSFADNKFWLVYTISTQIDGIFKDVKNYVITSDSIEGEWSKPIYLNSSGFDPSIFHDDNGKKYVINPLWNYRTGNGHVKFSGLVLQEYDHQKGSVVGEKKVVFKGSSTGGCEGPTLMKKDGFYYIIAAEGGTGRHHSIVVARSKDIFGTYEISPYHPLITSIHDPLTPLRKAGHGNMVKTDDEEWYLVHLCGRYLENKDVCPLGRETAIQNIEWIDGWPRLSGGFSSPRVEINAPKSLKREEYKVNNFTDTNFDNDVLPKEFMTLRTPFEEKMSLSDRKGYLRIFGGESLTSLFNQTLIARKCQSFNYTAESAIEFNPASYQQMAGMVCYYNTKNWIFAYVSYDEVSERRILNIMVNDNMTFNEPLRSSYVYIPRDHTGSIYIKVHVNQENLQYYYSLNQKDYYALGGILDASILSDEHSKGWAYTGSVVGITSINMDNNNSYADFDYFKYYEL